MQHSSTSLIGTGMHPSMLQFQWNDYTLNRIYQKSLILYVLLVDLISIDSGGPLGSQEKNLSKLPNDGHLGGRMLYLMILDGRLRESWTCCSTLCFEDPQGYASRILEVLWGSSTLCFEDPRRCASRIFDVVLRGSLTSCFTDPCLKDPRGYASRILDVSRMFDKMLLWGSSTVCIPWGSGHNL
jgi:hypothetical protein